MRRIRTDFADRAVAGDAVDLVVGEVVDIGPSGPDQLLGLHVEARLAAAVELVAQHGATDVRQVYANLVRATGFGKDFHRGEAVERLDAQPERALIEELLTAEGGGSAIFAARFRENAARALLLPRRRPGQRTPLWMQRQKSADLLAVARPNDHGVDDRLALLALGPVGDPGGDDVLLKVAQVGEGAPLVYLHGFVSSPASHKATLLRELSAKMSDTALCKLERLAPGPILTTLDKNTEVTDLGIRKVSDDKISWANIRLADGTCTTIDNYATALQSGNSQLTMAQAFARRGAYNPVVQHIKWK